MVQLNYTITSRSADVVQQGNPSVMLGKNLVSADYAGYILRTLYDE